MRVAFAVFLFVHAIAHGVGFLTVSGLVVDESQPTEPSFLLTGFAGDHWIFKVMAVVWLAPLVGFAIGGIGVIQEAEWARAVIVASTALSTILSLIWVKSAPFGLVANAIIIAALAIPWASDQVISPISQ